MNKYSISAIDTGENSQAVAAISRNTGPRRAPPIYSNSDSRQCFFCGWCGHIQRDCLTRKCSIVQTRYPTNNTQPPWDKYSRATNQPWRQPDDRSHWEREALLPLQQWVGLLCNSNNRLYVPPARQNNYVNTVQQVENEWPQDENDESETPEPTPTATKCKTGSRIIAPPTWLFTIFCLIMTVGMSNSQMKVMPMLCQSRSATNIPVARNVYVVSVYYYSDNIEQIESSLINNSPVHAGSGTYKCALVSAWVTACVTQNVLECSIRHHLLLKRVAQGVHIEWVAYRVLVERICAYASPSVGFDCDLAIPPPLWLRRCAAPGGHVRVVVCSTLDHHWVDRCSAQVQQ